MSWESKHKEVQEVKNLLRIKFWKETEGVAKVIKRLCKKRDSLTQKLSSATERAKTAESQKKNAEKRAQSEIRLAKLEMQKTTKRQKYIISQMEADAQKKAKEQFQPVKTKMKKQIKSLRENVNTIKEEKVFTDSLNLALKEKLKSESEKAINKAIIVETAYNEEKQALQEKNEKLKRLNEGLADKFKTLEDYIQYDDAKIKNLKKNYSKALETITKLQDKYGDLMQKHKSLTQTAKTIQQENERLKRSTTTGGALKDKLRL